MTEKIPMNSEDKANTIQCGLVSVCVCVVACTAIISGGGCQVKYNQNAAEVKKAYYEAVSATGDVLPRPTDLDREVAR